MMGGVRKIDLAPKSIPAPNPSPKSTAPLERIRDKEQLIDPLRRLFGKKEPLVSID
jgi:hypothetical protein